MNNNYDISEFVDVLTEKTVMDNISKQEKRRRKKLKISQIELAKKSGVSYSSIRRFERCGEISLLSLLKIANVLNCLEEFNSLFSNEIVVNLKDY